MNTARRWTTILVGLLLSLNCAAQQYTGTNLGAIPDGPSPAERYAAPRDIHFDVGPQRTVTNVSVRFTATHTYVNDLRVTLFAPNGNRHLLFARSGTTAPGTGYASDLNGQYIFTDNSAVAANWWTGAAVNPVPPGSYRTVVAGGTGVSNPPPVTSLDAQFRGTPAAGRWILRFEDGFAQDTGSVTAARLDLTLTGSTVGVTNANDSGSGSLRNAILGATNSGSLITFSPSFFATARTIELLTPLPAITLPMAIQGPGAEFLTVRPADSAGDMGIFTISGGHSGASISGMTISGGRSPTGGGIFSGSPLTLSGVHVSGNRADLGGGVLIQQGGQFINSTFSGNESDTSGAAIYAQFGVGTGTLRLDSCTVTGNRSGDRAAAIAAVALVGAVANVQLLSSTIADNQSAAGSAGIVASSNGTGLTVTLRNTIVANNTPANLQTFGAITITSEGFNLSNNYNNALALLTSDLTGDPRLGPLAPFGGSVPSRLLLSGSPALDAGDNSSLTIDLRGLPRPFDIPGIGLDQLGSAVSDIGAVEMQALIVTNTSDSGTGSLRAALTAANGNGIGQDDVIFDAATFATPQDITLSSALPSINSAITVSGTGADRLSVRRGGGTPQFRILTINAGLAVAAFSGIKMQGGTIATENGGGILSFSPLTLAGVHLLGNLGLDGGGVALMFAGGTIVDSTINSNNAIGRAAGVLLFNGGGLPLRIINSTISGNAATGTDGGIFVLVENNGTGSMEIINSTIAQNTATLTGGIASVSLGGLSAAVDIRNSIVTDNTVNNLGTFASTGTATIRSRGFNLSNSGDGVFFNQVTDQNGINPLLRPLALNGGGTPTHALPLGSAAVDAGNNHGSGQLKDQRGGIYVRPVDQPLINNVGDGSDVGAFELPPDAVFANGFE